MGCAALLFIFLQVSPVIGSRFGFKKSNTTWPELSKWLVNKGGWVQDSIHSDLTSHGGAMIRGLVLNSGSFMGSTLLEIPRHLWLELRFWPEIETANLAHHSTCSDLNKSQMHRLKFATGLAVESRKGDASEHAVYLKNLPALNEYHSFHPTFMSAALQEDFQSLPIVDFARFIQEDEAQMKGCFQAWQHDPQSPVQDVRWENIEVGLSHLRNRGFIVESNPILVPVVDLVNTERSDLINADVHFNMDVVSLVVASTWVSGDQELLYGYCTTCDNDQMMSQWGVYLEANSNPLPENVECGGHGSHLKEVSLAALDSGSYYEGKAPRCHQSLFSSEQGPLRCSLARLAWEYCGHEWEQDPGSEANGTLSTRASVPSASDGSGNFLKSTKAAKVKKSKNNKTQSSKVVNRERMVDSRFIPMNCTQSAKALHTSHGSSALRKRTVSTGRLHV